MRGKISATLVIIFSAISAPAHAETRSDWPADCKLERVAQLPMTFKSGHITIPASANGKDVTLGIDTGGYESSLTMAAVHRVGAAEVMFGAHLDKLQIGDLKWDSVYMDLMESFPGVDGLITHDVLDKYDVELDFGDNIFSLFKHHPCANRAVYWTGSYMAIPFTLTKDGHMRAPVTLDGQNTHAILDTGAPASVLSMDDASSMFGLTPDSRLEVAKPVSGPRAPFWMLTAPVKAANAYSYPFKKLALSGVTIPNPPIELVQARNFLGRDYATLLIGNDVLSRFHLYIAYQEQKLYITDAQAH